MTDADLRRILTGTQVIALVGASLNPARPSHRVGQFLVDQGYRVIPVNPGHAGKPLFGQVIVASLADAAGADMVDIFRRSETVEPIVDEALAVLPSLKTIWMQLDIVHEAAAAKARAAGIDVVMNRCPAIDIPRLGLRVGLAN